MCFFFRCSFLLTTFLKLDVSMWIDAVIVYAILSVSQVRCCNSKLGWRFFFHNRFIETRCLDNAGILVCTVTAQKRIPTTNVSADTGLLGPTIASGTIGIEWHWMYRIRSMWIKYIDWELPHRARLRWSPTLQRVDVGVRMKCTQLVIPCPG